MVAHANLKVKRARRNQKRFSLVNHTRDPHLQPYTMVYAYDEDAY